MKAIRQRMFEVIEASNGEDRLSSAYDSLMIVTIVISLLPLAFKGEYPVFLISDKLCTVVFILDYLLRLAVADLKCDRPGLVSFVRYPFTAMAIVDLLSILPSVTVINNGFKVLRVMRMVRAMRVLRLFKAARYSKSLQIIARVFKKSKEPLIAVGSLALAYILVSALVIISVEPDSFENFFDAVYWATISLTTMGYGDIYPVTTAGRLVTMLSSIFGIAIVALPAGIVTAGYMTELGGAEK